jgi:hypothetical protein
MAKSENNEVMFGARGQVGNLVVFKNYHGRTIISKVKTKKDNQKYTQDQELVKERFKEGVFYAKSVLLDEVLSNFYKPFENGPIKVYNLALADFCKSPEIKHIKMEHYQGNIDDQLTIRAIDNFRVVSVKVTISKDGEVMESGMAVQSPNGVDWIYTTTVQTQMEGVMIKAQATDTPGNVTTLELVPS